MNIFIIEVPESYDQYDIMMPYPYVTEASFESLWDYICGAVKAAKTYEYISTEAKVYIRPPTLKIGEIEIGYHTLLETNGRITVYKLKDWLVINNTRKKEENVNWSNFKVEF